jgi:hypothetical protein
MLLPDQTYDDPGGGHEAPSVGADLHQHKVHRWLRESVFERSDDDGGGHPADQEDEAAGGGGGGVPPKDEDACCVAKRVLRTLQTYDRFLQANGIKPDFFCRYREKLALQKLLLRKHAAACSHHDPQRPPAGESRNLFLFFILLRFFLSVFVVLAVSL